MDTHEIKRIVEALVFAADAPLSAERILETLGLQNGFDLNSVIDELNREYQESGRTFAIRQVAGGYQIVTKPDYASWIRRLYLGRQRTRLSQAALETLALIAFKQPISRVEIAQIRGVNSDGVIGTLLERRLITISGRAETVGRPLLYSTTPEFLKYFGLNDLADLPKPREIEELFGKEGMPEELVQALSQEDPQLSLPITAESETEPEVIPMDINDQVVEALGDPDPSEPTAEVPAATPFPVQTPDSQEQEPLQNLALDSNIDTMTAVAELEAADPSMDKPDEIAPETLAAGVDELFEASPELQSRESRMVEPAGIPESSTIAVDSPSILDEPQIVDESSLFPRVIENHPVTTADVVTFHQPFVSQPAVAEELQAVKTVPDTFENTFEVLLDTLDATGQEEADFTEENLSASTHAAPDLVPDPAAEIDGWLAEEFSQEEIAEPDFLLRTDDWSLDKPGEIRSEERPTEDHNDGIPAVTIEESVTPPDRAPSPGLDELTSDSHASGELEHFSASMGQMQMEAEQADLRRENFDEQTLRTDLWNDAATAEKSETIANTRSRWVSLREKAADWIKRAVNKLMTWVGMESDVRT
ncbi:MAG: SMC-Scp complex subunit ScpB [candidate division KSB1 bacterium]|nr:SMC-Scp complex subunit ScpB [candidate division KSB1 bacterium]MDZ7301008.1 SMC-Scp complex subunit ScpB [candidate division KSB1 bacterium]MDZ7310313.1 SMC-Scp complex subunit ScpB [candidate division KSB1 bacterium]